MTKILKEDNLEFDFSGSICAERFDDQRHGLSHCLKAVDFIVEWPHSLWLVEVKDPSSSTIPGALKAQHEEEFRKKMASGILFSQELGPKVKDSYFYLHLCDLLPQKPIRYHVLIGLDFLDPAMLIASTDKLKSSSCFAGPPEGGWNQPYLSGASVFNIETWNQYLNMCPVRRL